MIQRLALEQFKNFKNVKFDLGSLTLMVGTNASGKSNLRDAFRFLHGISRGYTLAEIIGEKWIEGGVLQWRGIRGGTREATYRAAATFRIQVDMAAAGFNGRYAIEADVGTNGQPPRVIRESLHQLSTVVFDSHPLDDPPAQEGPEYLFIRLPRDAQNRKHGKRLRFVSTQPVLTQIVGIDEVKSPVRAAAKRAKECLESMRFLDLSPDAMRLPSLPGQDILGDRGENLSSALQAICADGDAKHTVLEWIRELTPVDVVDFEFLADQTGRVLVSLVEADGRRTSAYSASDGTLRFLAMIAALLGRNAARFYFIEELENGIHPTRLQLLLQLIEQQVGGDRIQLVATSHSPQLLGFLSPAAREQAILVYRLNGQPDARVRRIMDLPDAARLLREQDFARLHASGWMEDAVAFEPSEAVS